VALCGVLRFPVEGAVDVDPDGPIGHVPHPPHRVPDTVGQDTLSGGRGEDVPSGRRQVEVQLPVAQHEAVLTVGHAADDGYHLRRECSREPDGRLHREALVRPEVEAGSPRYLGVATIADECEHLPAVRSSQGGAAHEVSTEARSAGVLHAVALRVGEVPPAHRALVGHVGGLSQGELGAG